MLNHTVFSSTAPDSSAGITAGPDAFVKLDEFRPAGDISQLITETGIRGLLDSFSDPFIILNFQGRIISFNEKADLMLKRIGQKIRFHDELAEKLPQERRTVVRDYVQRVSKGESLEYNILYPNAIWLLINMKPIRRGDQVIGVAVNFREVPRSRQKKNGNKLLSLLARESDKAVFITNKSGEIIWMNRQFTLLNGYTPKEAMGQNPCDLLSGPETNREVVAQIEEHMRQGKYFKCEILGYLANGEKRWHRLELQPILDEQRRPEKYFTVLSDCTEDKNLQQEMEIMAMVARETSNSVAILQEPDGRVYWVNEGFLNYTGRTLREVKGLLPGKLLAGPDTDHHQMNRLYDHIANGLEFQEDMLLYDKHGKGRWHNIHGKPFKREGAQNGKYFVIGRDISSRVKMEDERLQFQAEKQNAIIRAVLESKEEVKDRIGRELHDNINQMLAATKLQLEYALKHPEQNQELLSKSAEYLQEAINGIRSLSHELVAPRFSFETLADAIRKLTGRPGLKEAVTLITDRYDEALLSHDQRLALYRIVQEQFSNILKHARASQIHIILSTAGNTCRLEIVDNGIGCEKLGNSDGIGLMNIRHRAAQLKGTCQIESAPGRGCSLQIVIPL